jgi:hypothetical protein
MRYLLFDCFRHEDDEDIERSILRGDYDLFNYAATQWTQQLRLCVQHFADKAVIRDLCEEISDFVRMKENACNDKSRDSRKPSTQELKVFQTLRPDLRACITREDWFWRSKVPFYSLKTGTS